MRKIASLLLALVMVFSLTATAFASELPNLGAALATGSITITDNSTTGATVDGRTFFAIKALNASTSGSAIAYFIPAGMEDFYKTYFSITDADIAVLTLDEVVAERIEAMGDNSIALFNFGKAVYDWQQTAEGQAAGLLTEYAVGASGEAKFNNLPMGYYVVVDVSTISETIPTLSAVIIRTPGEDVSVMVKTDPPQIDKKIDGDTDTDPATIELVPFNNTSIGDKVPYVVTTDIPNMTPFEDYIYNVKDILSKGLTYNNDLTITISNGSNVNITLIEGEHYTETVTALTDAEGNPTGETQVFIQFLNFADWHKSYQKHTNQGNYWKLTNGEYTTKAPTETDAQALPGYAEDPGPYLNTTNYLGYEIKLTYSATINTDAIIGIEGNPNKVTLEYTNNQEDTTQTSVTTEHETRTYTTGLKLYKVDEAGNPLSGAKFKIQGTRTNIVLTSGIEFLPVAPEYIPAGTTAYYKLISGRYTETPATEDTESIYSTDVWYELKTNPVSYTQKSPVGLSDAEKGSYKDPTGETKINTYIQSKYENRPIEDTAAVDAEAFVDENGVVTFVGLGEGEYTITEMVSPGGYNMLRYPIDVKVEFTEPTATTSAAWSGQYHLTNEDGSAWQNLTWEGDTGVLSFSVENRTGTELPVTGGMGTTLFYVFGSIMMIGAAVMMVTKKRMDK